MRKTVLFCALAALSAGAAMRRGEDDWAGRASHPAVVNSVTAVDDGNILSMRGEWDFAPFRHARNARDLRYGEEKDFWGKPGAWTNARKIRVPGCWEAQGVGGEGLATGYRLEPSYSKLRIRGAHVGNGFYRKTVTIPAAWKGRRVWFKAGDVRNKGWIWINGKAVAHVHEAHRALKWEVTDIVTPGEPATVLIQVDNTYVTRNSQKIGYHRWGGLGRDVEFESTPAGLFIDDCYVRGDFDGRAAEVRVELGGASLGAGTELRVRVGDGDARTLTVDKPGMTPIRIPLARFRPWSPADPHLYLATVELLENGKVVQTRVERFGVRKLEVRGKEFYLNGKPFFFRGYGDDSTYPITGLTPADREYHLRNFRKARAAGFNSVRTHTHFEVPEYFEAADEAGILVQGELSYGCDESMEERFSYDPLRDAENAWIGYRRYTSFAVYSGGNEGTHGPEGGRRLYEWIKAHDPDRLVVEQDGGTYFNGHRHDTSDFASGPMDMWERCSFNPRAFICHEYANLAVKGDSRMEKDYTGAWLPRVTRAERMARLAPAGLGAEWGDLLQDAQHDFQRMWAIRTVEAARKDPYCDGYIYWTIVDYTHRLKKSGEVMCQGLFDPFWRTKPCGTSPEAMATVNSQSAILLDTEDRERVSFEDTDPMLCCGVYRRLVIDETNRVFIAGEKIPAEFILAHYGEDTLADARPDWELAAGGRRLAGGSMAIGDQAVGPARRVTKFRVTVPEVPRPVKAVLRAAVVSSGGGTVPPNSWDFWLFPETSAPAVPDGVVVAPHGSPEAEAARKAGRNLLLTGNLEGPRDIHPGWWTITWRKEGMVQNGLAFRNHALFRDFPYERFLSPLLFGFIGQGTPLPVAGFAESDFIAVSEGNEDFRLFLAAKERPDGGREVFVSGLHVFADAPEARTLLADIFTYLSPSRQY